MRLSGAIVLFVMVLVMTLPGAADKNSSPNHRKSLYIVPQGHVVLTHTSSTDSCFVLQHLKTASERGIPLPCPRGCSYTCVISTMHNSDGVMSWRVAELKFCFNLLSMKSRVAKTPIRMPLVSRLAQ